MKRRVIIHRWNYLDDLYCQFAAMLDAAFNLGFSYRLVFDEDADMYYQESPWGRMYMLMNSTDEEAEYCE